MHEIPPSSRELMVDEFNRSAEGLARDKAAASTEEECRVLSYDVMTQTAIVLPLRAGYGDGIRVRVRTLYQGETKGTGGADALYKGQNVKVSFVGGSQYGLYNQPEVTGTVYLDIDRPAPAYAPWQQDGTGHVVVHAGVDGAIGSARHVSGTSQVSETHMGDIDIEHWGNEHVVMGGSNVTQAEVQMRQAGTVLKASTKTLMGA